MQYLLWSCWVNRVEGIYLHLQLNIFEIRIIVFVHKIFAILVKFCSNKMQWTSTETLLIWLHHVPFSIFSFSLFALILPHHNLKLGFLPFWVCNFLFVEHCQSTCLFSVKLSSLKMYLLSIKESIYCHENMFWFDIFACLWMKGKSSFPGPFWPQLFCILICQMFPICPGLCPNLTGRAALKVFLLQELQLVFCFPI